MHYNGQMHASKKLNCSNVRPNIMSHSKKFAMGKAASIIQHPILGSANFKANVRSTDKNEKLIKRIEMFVLTSRKNASK